MGTATFDICRYGSNGSDSSVPSGRLTTSGAHTTSTSATNLTNGAAGGGTAISAVEGDVLHIQGDEAMRLAFGGTAATATLGHVIFAGETRYIEIPASGTISIIDVA